MAQKVNEAMLHEMGLNPFAAKLLVESYSTLIANHLGQVGAVEFELHGIVVSLRHPAHTKIVEGMPTELIRAGIIQRLMQLAEDATNYLNLMHGHASASRLELALENLLTKLDMCNQAIKENRPDLIALPTPEQLGYGENTIESEEPSSKIKLGEEEQESNSKDGGGSEEKLPHSENSRNSSNAGPSEQGDGLPNGAD